MTVRTFVEPCLPSKASQPPTGEWLHEIKIDGYRLMASRDVSGLRLMTRRGLDIRFPVIAAAIAKLSFVSCTIDGEVAAPRTKTDCRASTSCDDVGQHCSTRSTSSNWTASIFGQSPSRPAR